MKPSPDAPRMPSKLGQIRGNPDGWQPYQQVIYVPTNRLKLILNQSDQVFKSITLNVGWSMSQV